MACERRWWFSCCYVNLLFLAVGFSTVIADRGDSYYHYDRSLASSDNSILELTRFYPHNELLTRIQRSPIELPLKPANETDNSTLSVSTTTIKSNTSLENVAYSTDNNTKITNSSQPATVTTSVVKPEVIVSQPLNPLTGKTDTKKLTNTTIWANATRWANATHLIIPSVQLGQNTTTQNVSKSVPLEDAPTDDISINKFGDVTNTTLSQYNITKTINDTHQYYNSSFSVDEAEGRRFWIDMANHPNASVNEVLSHSHRRATTVKLSFDFPFYGHMVRNITIATGGFLYTGEYVHSWLAATQYIAPLMANFDTRLSNNSNVTYADNGTAFTVEWKKVVLQEKPSVGEFTFQVTLLKNGDIIFVYAAVPLVVEQIQDNLHPVKVGLSDAYIIDRTVFFVRRKTIYEYHRVNFMSQDIKNWTVIHLRALPTCLGMHTCTDCLSKSTGFECKWCPSLNRCSTGTDRHRQDWLLNRCNDENIKQGKTCPGILPAIVQPSQHHAVALGPPEHTPDKMKMGVSGIIGILLVVSLIAGFIGWTVYAYRNPHSASGQVLIRYRPSQWSWRRGEARYTAATIHM